MDGCLLQESEVALKKADNEEGKEEANRREFILLFTVAVSDL